MPETQRTEAKVKRLIWDIEVSPNVGLFWRPGFKVSINPDAIVDERKIICIGYKWQGERKTHVLRWDGSRNDKAMLKAFLYVLEEADEAIAHFGDSFDLPWIRGRCLIHGLEPLPLVKTVDTKAWASKYFYFNSNKLDYLGSVLGFGHKHDTDFQMWKDITLNTERAPAQLNRMCNYCARDVELLEKVYDKLQTSVSSKTHAGVFAGHDRWSCPRCASESVKSNKRVVTPAGMIRHQMRCNKCHGYYQIPNFIHERYKKAKASNANQDQDHPCGKASPCSPRCAGPKGKGRG
jgi:hypothetical protein